MMMCPICGEQSEGQPPLKPRVTVKKAPDKRGLSQIILPDQQL
jgi:hypothetical protein